MNLSEPYTTHTCNIQYMACMCGLYMYIDINLFCVNSCLAVEVFLSCSRVPVTVIKNVPYSGFISWEKIFANVPVCENIIRMHAPRPLALACPDSGGVA